MNERIKRLPVLLGLLLSLMGFSAEAQCPNLALNETIQDCPWADITRSTADITDGAKIREIINSKAPTFMAQIDKDAYSPDLLNLWGLSSNIDVSNLATGIRTVPVNLLQYFVSLWNVPYNKDFSIGHAGLNHTYGYLLSNLNTPFGFKRARYVKGELEEGFGISDGMFSGAAKEGTLLSNLTSFAGTIAFRDSRRAQKNLLRAVRRGEITYIPELAHYNYGSLDKKRLVEVINNDQFYLELRTDIVNFPKTNTRGADTALLIYSMDYRPAVHGIARLFPHRSAPLLITAFPVQASFAAGLFSQPMGDKVQLKLNYNAALPVTIPAELMVGKRFILNESNTASN